MKSASSLLLLTFVVLLVVTFSSTTLFAQEASSPNPRSGNCNTNEAYWIPDGRDYRGSISVTRSGIPCQPWSAQSPHRHATLIDGSIGIGAHSACRNPSPDSMSSPWCYTSSPSVLFEVCNVGLPCTEGTEGRKTQSVVFSPDPAKEIISPAVISLSSPTFNASVYYSFDNNVAPTVSSSKLYDSTDKIVIVGSGFVTIRAFAVRPGFQPSLITTASYQILPPSLPKVNIFPSADQIDKNKPVLVTLSVDAANNNNNGNQQTGTYSQAGLELRYRIVDSAQLDTNTVITQSNSNLFVKGQPFWVRSSATVVAASFVPAAAANVHITNSTNNNNQQQPAPSPMSRAFFGLTVPRAQPPVVAPTSASASVDGYGRVVFVLDAPNIQQPTYEVCLNFSSFFDGAVESRCREVGSGRSQQQQQSSSSVSIVSDNAFHLTTLGVTNVAFRVFGPSSAPSEFVNITATVRPMPLVRLSVPSQADFVGPVDVSASCALSTFRFFVNGEIRVPPIVLSEQGTYNIEAYAETVFDKGAKSSSVVTIQASNLPKPILSPLPDADVPGLAQNPFVFASPLLVQLRPLSYLGGHAYFKIDVFKVDSKTGQRVQMNDKSADQVPSNITTTLTFEGADDSSVSTFIVIATTKCITSTTSSCSLVNASITSEVTYNVAGNDASSPKVSTPTFLVRRIDGVSQSEITEQKILKALYISSSSSSMKVSVRNSGDNVFFSLDNLTPRLALQYTNWLVSDLSSSSRSARSASLRLRLGFESPISSPKVAISSSSTNIACLSSTALSASIGTSNSYNFNVESCSQFCFDKFPTKTSIIAVLSPPNRCDCLDTSSFGFSSSSSTSNTNAVMSNANFVSDPSLCSNPCTNSQASSNNFCGGTVADPAKYNLWSSTVCSAYLSFRSTGARSFPSVSSWELVQADGMSFAEDTKKYYSTTTSVLKLKLGLPSSFMTENSDNTNQGRVVLIKRTPTSNCASDAAALLFSSSQAYASSTSSYNEQLLLGYASTFSYSSGLTTQDMIAPLVGEYRICVSFPQAQYFGDNKTFVEVSNSATPQQDATFSYLHIIQGQYYPVSVFPKPGTYYSRDTMTINVSTTTKDAYLKITVDADSNTNTDSNGVTSSSSNTKIYQSSWALITLSGSGKHTIISTAISSKGEFHGSPLKSDYVLAPEPTINSEVAASYLAAALYSFTTTSIGSIRISLSQYGTVRVGSCDDCRVQLLPPGAKCSSLNSNSYTPGDQEDSMSSLGPYASGTFSRDDHASNSNNNNNQDDNNNGNYGEDSSSSSPLSYISSELMISAPVSQEPLVVCVGGPPWYRILPTEAARKQGRDSKQVLSVSSAGIGFCQSSERDQMCSQNGGVCTHVSFSGTDEYGCFCPDQESKRWTTIFCSNNSKLPTIWNGTIFDVKNYKGDGKNGGSGDSINLEEQHGSWGAFLTLVFIYVLSLGALWYHKNYRSKPLEKTDEQEMASSGTTRVNVEQQDDK